MDDKVKTNVWKNTCRTISLICKSKPMFLLSTFVSILVNSLFPIISLLVMQSIINIIQVGNTPFKTLVIYIIIYTAIDLLQTCISGITGYFNGKYTMSLNLTIRKMILEKISRLSLSDFEKSETYNIIQRAQNESEVRIPMFFNKIVQMIATIMATLSYVVILLSFRKWIIVFILIVPTVKYIIIKRINQKQFAIINKRTGEERKAWYYNYIMVSGNFDKELKLYKLYEYFTNKFVKFRERFIQQDVEISKESMQKITLLSIVEQIFDGGIFAYIVHSGLKGEILIGNVITYTRSIMKAKENIQTVLQSVAEIEKESLYIDYLYNLLGMEEEASDLYKIKIDKLEEISLVNLSYKYNRESNYVLKNINLKLNIGSTYAILGVNGSGKSTLAKIITGFYDGYEGDIYVNGINLKDIDKKCYMEKIGVLFQDFGKYEATFRENVAYGNLNIINDDSKIMEIADEFKLKHLIDKSEKKLDTQLGYWFDSGKQISIGQWQKIAICRVFLRNANLYILDEPNAALDAISEFDLATMYKDVLKNRIGVIIAHRFSHFINIVDEIIIIENGEISEKGTHTELLSRKGIYEKLYSLQ